MKYLSILLIIFSLGCAKQAITPEDYQFAMEKLAENHKNYQSLSDACKKQSEYTKKLEEEYNDLKNQYDLIKSAINKGDLIPNK